jgi:hypothetical protein
MNNMNIACIQHNKENICVMIPMGERTDKEILAHNKQVFDHLNIPVNYITFPPVQYCSHGNALEWFVKNTLELVDYYIFFETDSIPLRRDIIDVIYNKLKDKQTLFGAVQQSNHKNKNHPCVGPHFLCFSKELYIKLGMPSLNDHLLRSDTAEELTWEVENQGYNLSLVYPSNYYGLTDEEMKASGNPRYWDLGNGFRYGLCTSFRDYSFHVGTKSPRSKQMFIDKCNEIVGQNRKMEAIIVSVNYGDFLSITLPQNKKYFDEILVITTSDDLLTKQVCAENNVACIESNKFYENGAKFNKGAALSESFSKLRYKDWVCVLDADCLLNDSFLEKFDKNTRNIEPFYGGGRTFIYSYEDYMDYLNGLKKLSDFDYYEGKGNGYMQLFNLNSQVAKSEPLETLYPSNSENVLIDIIFLKKFCPTIEKDPNLIDLGIDVIHLGLHSVFKNGRGEEARFDYFKNKTFKQIKRDEIQEYIKEVNK